ncbi:hypothetical protein T05_15542 [Trichinella murrelli]|uniref:Uncharacterized protein n=1 Tax=Trichinella murrelli TaxID=144512 RepID=A0A0V0TH32_9BILA|nr:hypothetical protein T05_15542 [Trichinella murrelli]
MVVYAIVLVVSKIKEGRRRGSLLTSMVIWIADENSQIIRFDRAAHRRLSSIYISGYKRMRSINIREAVELYIDSLFVAVDGVLSSDYSRPNKTNVYSLCFDPLAFDRTRSPS